MAKKYGTVSCEITGLRTDMLTGGVEMTLTIPKSGVSSAHRIVQEAKGKALIVDIADFKRKRSLDANAYMWVLCAKISERTGVDKSDVYRRNVRELPDNFYLQLMRSDTVEAFAKYWGTKGIGWFVETVDESPGHPGYSWVHVYYGSSVYDTAQMSRLIDNVIWEAKTMDIETLTPEEIARMKEAWT